MPVADQPPRRKKLLVSLFICICVLVAAGLVFDVYGKSRQASMLKDAYAMGGPVTFEEILAARQGWSGKQNGADVLLGIQWRAEADALARPVPFVGEAESPGLGHRWSEGTGQAVDRYLAEVAGELDQIDRLKDCDGGAFPFMQTSVPEAVVQAELPRLAQTRQVVKLKSLQVVSRAMAGDVSHLSDDFTVLLRPGDIAANSPLLISHLTASACESLGVSVLEDVMALTSVPADQLSRMQEMLAARQNDGKLARALRGERAYMIASLDTSRMKGAGLQRLVPGVRGWLSRDLGFGIGLYNQLILAAQDPSQLHLVQSVTSAAQGRAGSIVSLSIPSLVKSFELDARRVAEIRCASVALAAERYRLATGQWPSALEQLVPDYMDSLPRDPFAPDQPLRLSEQQNRIVIYSVGPDRVDGEGNVRRGKDYASATDWGFILLNPALRNQPPVAESQPVTKTVD